MVWCQIGNKPLSEPMLTHWRIYAAPGGDELMVPHGLSSSMLRNQNQKVYFYHRIYCSLQNKCKTSDPDQQNLGRSGKLSFFIIYKFWQNCAWVWQVLYLILKTDTDGLQPMAIQSRIVQLHSPAMFTKKNSLQMILQIFLKVNTWNISLHHLYSFIHISQ